MPTHHLQRSPHNPRINVREPQPALPRIPGQLGKLGERVLLEAEHKLAARRALRERDGRRNVQERPERDLGHDLGRLGKRRAALQPRPREQVLDEARADVVAPGIRRTPRPLTSSPAAC